MILTQWLVIFLCLFTISTSSNSRYQDLNDDDDEAQLDILDWIAEKNHHRHNVADELVGFTERLSDYSQISSKIGQIGGLATQINGNLVVFHRATRQWKTDSFLANNRFNPKYSAIQADCVVHIDPATKQIVNSWGSGLFYMPHGLNIDHEQNVWLTDVGLHQIFKFNKGDYTKPSLVLGEAFVSGNDDKHFCKPSDVVVRPADGHIFVSDGYCNDRVIEFDANGQFVRNFRSPIGAIRVAHSLALIADQNLICVADRENNRILCFNTQSGELAKTIDHSELTRLFAIEYDPIYKLLHAVTGGDYSGQIKPLGYTFDVEQFGNILARWQPQGSFSDPHDLTISPNSQTIYVGELDGSLSIFELQN